MTQTLRSFVEEVRGWGHRAELTDAERVGIQSGGGVDQLLRARLRLDAATHGESLLQSLDERSPDLEPLAREFLASCMGVTRSDFQVARLDVRSRWEGAVAEAGRWLGRGSGAFAWVIDDALSLDAESLALVSWLAQSADFPGLVVLAVRDDERGVFETRLKTLRSTGRLNELQLPALDSEALQAAFPSTARAARGSPLVAALLEASGSETSQAVSLEAAVRLAQQKLTTSELDLLSLLAANGGRLPLEAAGSVLEGEVGETASALQRRLLVHGGPTSRCFGAHEVWLRFPAQAPAASVERRAFEGVAGLARSLGRTAAAQ
ncbi:MAG: hypothetical protein ACO1OB_01725 [Archangium sp.]